MIRRTSFWMTYLSMFFYFCILALIFGIWTFSFLPPPPLLLQTLSSQSYLVKLRGGFKRNIWGRIESFRLHRSPMRVYLSFGVSWTLNPYVTIIVIPTCLEHACIYGSQLIFPLSFLRRFWMKSIRQDSVPWSTLTISQIPSLTRTSLLWQQQRTICPNTSYFLKLL